MAGNLGWPHLPRLQPSGAAYVGRKTRPLRKQRPPYLREMALWDKLGGRNFCVKHKRKRLWWCRCSPLISPISLSLFLHPAPTCTFWRVGCTFRIFPSDIHVRLSAKEQGIWGSVSGTAAGKWKRPTLSRGGFSAPAPDWVSPTPKNIRLSKPVAIVPALV